jgi:diaminohydroxyphosphoribosylaminopyrimidine deaminase/5-amino-6-(5-phosphoribosylamino)uracil reductase
MPVEFSQDDERWMRRALALARRGAGWVESNPMVGCVLVRDRRMLGEGYYRRYGGPHAEIDALARATGSPRGATAYVTLEPCCFHGKTPPCTDALIAARIQRVIIAVTDPHPRVAGEGVAQLRRAGIRVDTGLLAAEAAELIAPHRVRVTQQRPFVIAKWAQSLDGKIATRLGDSQWISGPGARRIVHRLRARVDAVAVGANTVQRDDPALTARDVPVRRVAVRVVVDSRLRLPTTAQLVAAARDVPTLVFTTRAAPVARQRRLERLGVEVVRTRAKGGQVSLAGMLRVLYHRGHTNLLVEGGGTLIGSLFDGGWVDEAHVFTAPLIIGGRDAPTGCDGTGLARLRDARPSRCIERRVIGGRDAYTRLRFGANGELAGGPAKIARDPQPSPSGRGFTAC